MTSKTLVVGMFAVLGIASLMFLVGCGGSTAQSMNQPLPPPPPPPAPTGVIVLPASATVTASGMQQFTATVNPNGANQAITWSLSGTGCNGANCGIIDATGNYTAPATAPNPPTVMVTGRSVADSTKAASAAVTIINTLSSFSLNPSSLAFGNQTINTTSAARTVTLTNTGNVPAALDFAAINGVDFREFAQTNNCSSVIAVGANCTFDVTFTPTATGDIVALLVVSDEGHLVNLTGTGTAAAANSDNAKLSGQYAFLFRGFNSAGPMSVIGSFTADGNGNMIAGNTDVATVGGTLANQGLTHSTYSVGSDGSGSMTLNTGVNFPNDNVSFSFSFALDSFSSPGGVAAGGRLIESDGTDQTGTGFFVKQDPAAFSTTAINGGYAFGLSAPQGILENVALGRFTASGGSLSAGHMDLVGFGTDRLQPDQPFAGTYSVDASSRGEVTLNISGQPAQLRLISYVVSSGESIWMDADGTGATGMALQQSGGPFNTSSLDGIAVFGTSGFTVAGNDVAAGGVQFDGMGNVGGLSDEKYFGSWAAGEPISGSYTVDSNGLGRGVINSVDGPGLFVFYLVSPDRGFTLSGNDSLAFGSFEPQTGSPFSNASFSGNYALGTLPLLSKFGTSYVSAVLAADGAGKLSGSLTTNAGTQNFTGTYSVAANGRTTLSITLTSRSPSTLVFYFASPSEAFGIQADAGVADAAAYIIEK